MSTRASCCASTLIAFIRIRILVDVERRFFSHRKETHGREAYLRAGIDHRKSTYIETDMSLGPVGKGRLPAAR